MTFLLVTYFFLMNQIELKKKKEESIHFQFKVTYIIMVKRHWKKV